MNLKNLNPNQRLAVEHVDSPIMILAGAGSGKTRTLVARISYLLNVKKVGPYKLLALTFSNKAAREMRERVATEVDFDLGALQITTFHSFCVRVLRNEVSYLGLSKNFTIYDGPESKAVVKTLLGRKGISTKEISPFDIISYIEQIKNLGHYQKRSGDLPYKLDTGHEFHSFYEEYENELFKANSVDFGGLICGVIELFEKFPEVKERYQRRFDYVLVDEYQDTNKAQFELLQMLVGSKRNICVVGDEDQSIYSWRGADITNILDFEKVYPDVKIIKLEQNYRSSKNIIEAASRVISHNSQRKGKKMWTQNPEGESIEIVECYNDKDEAQFLAQEILKISQENIRFDEMAIFYRTNSQSRLIEDYLHKHQIPYRIVGGTKFYERKEVKDMLAYLRLVTNDKDTLAIGRIINVPARGIGATSLRKLEDEATRQNLSLWEVLGDVVEKPEKYKGLRLSAKIKSSLRELFMTISEVKVLEKRKVSPAHLFEKLLHETGYLNHLKLNKNFETISRIENLEELQNAIKQYEKSEASPSLLGFLETITLEPKEQDEKTLNRGQLSLMTIHGAKGLEFLYVFLAGAEENLFPSYKSIELGPVGLEEERRLFYVAMTRAMKKLFISFAQGRLLFGQVKFNGYSRFIDEIPESFYFWRQEGNGRQDDDQDFFGQDIYYDDDNIYQQDNKSRLPKFSRGEFVNHDTYGSGQIIHSEGLDEDEKVTVLFKDGMKKKFLAHIAPLYHLE